MASNSQEIGGQLEVGSGEVGANLANLPRLQQQQLAQQQLQRLTAAQLQHNAHQPTDHMDKQGHQLLAKGINVSTQQLAVQQQQQAGRQQMMHGQKQQQYVVMVGAPGQMRPTADAQKRAMVPQDSQQTVQQHQQSRLQQRQQQQQQAINAQQQRSRHILQQPQATTTMFTTSNSTNAQTNQNIQYRVHMVNQQITPKQQFQQQQYIQQQRGSLNTMIGSGPPPKRQRKLTGEPQRQNVPNSNKDIIRNAVEQASLIQGSTKLGTQRGGTASVNAASPVVSSHQQSAAAAAAAAKQQLHQLNQRMVAPQPRLPHTPTTGSFSPHIGRPAGAAGTPTTAGGTVNGNLPSQQTPPLSAPHQNIPASQMGNMSTSTLVVGEEYVIQYSNGRKVVGTWDGKFFKIKPAPSTAALTTQAPASGTSSTSHVAGGGGASTTAAIEQQGGENGQQQWSSDGLAQTTSNQAQPDQQQQLVPTPTRPARPSEEGKYAVCNHCGAHSAHYDVCESCKRALPDDVKYYSPSGNTPAASNKRQRVLDTTPQKVAQQVLMTYQQQQQGKGGSKAALHTFGEPVRKAGKSLSSTKKTPVKRPRGRQRGQHAHSIETVTILSSEDEEDSNSRHSSDMGAASPAPPPALGSCVGNQIAATSANTSIAASPASIPSSTFSSSQQPLSAAIPTTQTMSALRQQQLQQLPQQQLLALRQQQAAKQLQKGGSGILNCAAVRLGVISLAAARELPIQSQVPNTLLQPGTTVLVKTRSIRIGSLKTSSSDAVSFNLQGISFVLQLPDTTRLQVLLPAKELTCVLAHFGRAMPLLFVRVSASCAAKLRHVFSMMPGAEPYFDPDAKQSHHKGITLTLSAMTDQVQETIVQICHHIQKENPDMNGMDGGGRLLTELDYNLANNFLIASTTAAHEDNDDDELQDRSRSPSPPRVFAGEIVKLFTYPPPPATGGIPVTNEDLFCLNEGEFLNDVIIDFYLKYLLTGKLSQEDQDRTHVFSSFFYRRLTQKQARRDEMPNMTPAQRRHSRVRTWTRHVDLFEKDFVIVPINESAHWYLAIICFPGLRNQVIGDAPYEKFPAQTAPSTPTSADNQAESESKSQANGAEGTSENSSDKCKDNGNKSKHKAVLKQPCILIFDSLAGPSRSSVIKILREYLQVEWDMKKKEKEGIRIFDKDSFKGTTPKAPQQTNFSDCGVYVLQYVESFYQSPLIDYNIPMRSLQNWFTEETVIMKRPELAKLLMELQRELNPSLDYDPKEDGCLLGLKDEEDDEEDYEEIMGPGGPIPGNHHHHHHRSAGSAPHVVTQQLHRSSTSAPEIMSSQLTQPATREATTIPTTLPAESPPQEQPQSETTCVDRKQQEAQQHSSPSLSTFPSQCVNEEETAAPVESPQYSQSSPLHNPPPPSSSNEQEEEEEEDISSRQLATTPPVHCEPPPAAGETDDTQEAGGALTESAQEEMQSENNQQQEVESSAHQVGMEGNTQEEETESKTPLCSLATAAASEEEEEEAAANMDHSSDNNINTAAAAASTNNAEATEDTQPMDTSTS